MTDNSDFDKTSDFDKSNKGNNNNNNSLNDILKQAKSKKEQLIKQLDQKLEQFVDEIIRKIDLKDKIETAVGKGLTECAFSVPEFAMDERDTAVECSNETMTFTRTYRDAYLAFCKRFKGELRLSGRQGDLSGYERFFYLAWDE